MEYLPHAAYAYDEEREQIHDPQQYSSDHKHPGLFPIVRMKAHAEIAAEQDDKIKHRSDAVGEPAPF